MRIARQQDEIRPFLSDESHLEGGHADRVVWPGDERELAEFVREAGESGELITVSGAGTGVAGGRIPFGGTVVATDSYSSIGPVVQEGAYAFVEVGSGVRLSELDEHLRKTGPWMFPPDPTEWSAQIGGMLATNASGARSFLFGATRAWAEAIDVVLPTGALVRLARGDVTASSDRFDWTVGRHRFEIPVPSWAPPRTTKHAAGYWPHARDLVDLFIGSEGTLGIITKARLRLRRRPTAVLTGMIFLDSVEKALQLAQDARETKREAQPWSVEYLDPSALQLVASRLDLPSGAVCSVSFEHSVDDESQRESVLERWAQLAESYQAIDVWIADDLQQARRLRDVRHAVPVTINERNARRGVVKLSTDSAVPHASFAGFLEIARRKIEASAVDHAIFGHLGDSHLHINLMAEDPERWESAHELLCELDRCAVECGGTVSAEHGIGKLKRQRLRLLYDDTVIAHMARIKATLDPKGILGRGTIWAEPL